MEFTRGDLIKIYLPKDPIISYPKHIFLNAMRKRLISDKLDYLFGEIVRKVEPAIDLYYTASVLVPYKSGLVKEMMLLLTSEFEIATIEEYEENKKTLKSLITAVKL